MATTGEQLAAWKQLGGTVKTVKKNKEFIAPGGEKRERVFFLDDWGTTDGDFEKKDDAQHVDFGCLRSPPLRAFSFSLIRLKSHSDGDVSVSAGLEFKENEKCESRRARSEARVWQPSQQLNRCSPLPFFASSRRRAFLGCSLTFALSFSTLVILCPHLYVTGEKFSSWAEASEFAKTIEGKLSGERKREKERKREDARRRRPRRQTRKRLERNQCKHTFNFCASRFRSRALAAPLRALFSLEGALELARLVPSTPWGEAAEPLVRSERERERAAAATFFFLSVFSVDR